jgi:TonB family protein
VLHEAEHVLARDPQLALAGLLLCALAPWNLPLWWQLRRLRLAIEVDCDDRVLRRAGDASGYGSLLLEVSQRKAHLALALAESRSMLERRIRMITKSTTGPATLRAIALAAVAGLVLAVACETPGPTGPGDRGADVIELREVREAGSSLGARPCDPAVFAYGTWSSTEVMDAIDPANVESIHVFSEDSPTPPDAAACGVIVVLTKDASVDDEAAARRVVEELTMARRAAAEVTTSPIAVQEDIEDGPTFTPMTVRPRLRNADAVRTALELAYPSSLRQGGIGGTTNVWFFIDAEGSVRKVMVNEASDYEALDQAALEVARTMEFTPAYNREQRVPVWIALDITFQPTR